MISFVDLGGLVVPESFVKERSSFERHAQTTIASIMLLITVGAGTVLLSLRDDMATIKAELSFLRLQMNNEQTDKFRGADWLREKQIMESRFDGLRYRVEQLERERRNVSNGNVQETRR